MATTETVTAPAPHGTPRVIPRTDLVESKTNPRRHFDPVKLKELAASIAKDGILAPLLVRPKKGSNKFEIVAGARRLRAATDAGLADIPCLVHDYSDAQVLEIQVIENKQRDDLHPLEEAEGYERLLQMEGYTVELIAERISMDPSYIYKRRQLARLIEPLKKAFFDGEIGLAHASAVCRHEPGDQALILKDGLFRKREVQEGGKWVHKGREVVEMRSLRDWISRNLLLVLKDAPWDLEDPTLVGQAGSCTACPKRSGRNMALFSDLSDGDDCCLDASCYQGKLDAQINREIARAKAAGATLALVVTGYVSPLPKHALQYHQFRKVEGKHCASAEGAIVIAGSDAGAKLTICKDQKCKVHFGHGGSAPKLPAQQWAEKAKQLGGKIQLAVREAVLADVLAKVAASGKIEQRELALLAERIVDRWTFEDMKAIAKHYGIEKPKGYSGELGKMLRPRFIDPRSKDFAVNLVSAVLVPAVELGQYGPKKNILDLAATAYKINVAAIAKAKGKTMRQAFALKRDKALAKVKAGAKAKSPDPEKRRSLVRDLHRKGAK